MLSIRIESGRMDVDLAFGALNCMGRHTLTGMLTASRQQFMDWSSAYRLFSQRRVDTSKLFEVAIPGVLQEFVMIIDSVVSRSCQG